MRKKLRGNLYFFDPAADRLILRARTGSNDARRQLLQAIADQAVPHGDLPNPLQRLIQSAFSQAARSSEPGKELLKQLGLRTVGRPRAELTPEQDGAIFSLAFDLYVEKWRRKGCRMSKQCRARSKELAESIGITTQGLDKTLDDLVIGFEQDAEWRHNEAE